MNNSYTIILDDGNVEITYNLPTGAQYRALENAKALFFKRHNIHPAKFYESLASKIDTKEIDDEILNLPLDDNTNDILKEVGFSQLIEMQNNYAALYYDEEVFNAICLCLANSTYKNKEGEKARPITKQILDDELYYINTHILAGADFFFLNHFKKGLNHSNSTEEQK